MKLLSTPVIFPPGRGRPAMNPAVTASSPDIMTMGIVVVACWTARIKGAGPPTTMTSTGSRTSSAASSAPRSALPDAQRYSTCRRRLGGERRHNETEGEGDEECNGVGRHGSLRQARMCWGHSTRRVREKETKFCRLNRSHPYRRFADIPHAPRSDGPHPLRRWRVLHRSSPTESLRLLRVPASDNSQRNSHLAYKISPILRGSLLHLGATGQPGEAGPRVA
jgi:hypothetical protein